MSHKQSLRKTYVHACLLRTCSCYQSLSGDDFEFCHFLSIHYSLLGNRTLDSTNDCTIYNSEEKFKLMLEVLSVQPGFQVAYC